MLILLRQCLIRVSTIPEGHTLLYWLMTGVFYNWPNSHIAEAISFWSMLLFFNKVSALILDYSKPNNSNSKKHTAELSTQFLF